MGIFLKYGSPILRRSTYMSNINDLAIFLNLQLLRNRGSIYLMSRYETPESFAPELEL
jgi:hypothetical protein